MARRIAIFAILATGVLAVLAFRLWALQVISGDQYAKSARENRIRTFRIQPPRGSIVDRNGKVLVSNRAGTVVQLWPQDLPEARKNEVITRLGQILDLPVSSIRKRIREQGNDPLSPITLKTDIRPSKADYLLEHKAELPGVSVASVGLRRHEQGQIAAQVLGFVGEIDREELKAHEDGNYAAGDQIGKTGIERAYDRYLRGAPGIGQVRIDAYGQLTGPRRFARLPQAGYAIRLTLDADLQRRAEDALRGAIQQARSDGEWASDGGAIVAMNPQNGEILALASNPTFDPALYVGRIEKRELKRLSAPGANHPTLNRATEGIYPPGSTFKPVTALAALQEGVLEPGELIQCSPQVRVDGQVFRNWTYVNEPMTLRTALAASCDTYFYELGLRFYLMPEERGSPLQRWARRMGFGQHTRIDVGPESEGLLPTPAWRKRTFTDPVDRLWKSGDSVQLAIGQKDMLVTPLQMTRFYALIANGGNLVWPHMVSAIEQPGSDSEPGAVLRMFAPRPPKSVGLNPGALAVVREGLFDATHASYGTSSAIFGAFPVAIAGKTGTAEKVIDLPGFRGTKSQAWWCGYGPVENPEITVCVVVENGGFGGKVAAPAALKVFEQYFGVKGAITGSVSSD